MSKQERIEGLNQDLAAGPGTVIRYTYQAAQGYGLRAAGEAGHGRTLCRLLKGL